MVDPDWNDGWDGVGKANRQPTIQFCLQRAAACLQWAYQMRFKKDGTKFQTSDSRDRWSRMGNGYANLALALQAEREYQERKIQEIKRVSQDWFTDAQE